MPIFPKDDVIKWSPIDFDNCQVFTIDEWDKAVSRGEYNADGGTAYYATAKKVSNVQVAWNVFDSEGTFDIAAPVYVVFFGK